MAKDKKRKVVQAPPMDGAKQEKELSVTALLDEMEGEAQDIIPEADAKTLLDKADLSLPHEFELEILADELLGTLSTYKRATFGRRAARNLGDNQRAQQMSQLERYARLTSALMLSETPGLKAVANEVASFRVLKAQRERAQILNENEEE